jgi:hypothetical protein
MIGPMRAPRVCIGAAAVVILAAPAACAQKAQNGQKAQTAQNVPAKDAFKGHVRTATGTLSQVHGAVGIDLVHTGPGKVKLIFRGRGCGGKNHCLQPSGTLTGTMTPVFKRTPDIGTSFTINVSGKLAPLGHVSATGTAQGTGFIVHGYDYLQLKLATRQGTVAYDAQSGPVQGFTSP